MNQCYPQHGEKEVRSRPDQAAQLQEGIETISLQPLLLKMGTSTLFREEGPVKWHVIGYEKSDSGRPQWNVSS